MALVKCPECYNAISDRCSACPHCGCPTRLLPTDPVVTERTAKTWKVYELVGVLLILASIPCCLAVRYAQSDLWGLLGFTACPLGVLCYVVGRVGAWWHHG